MPERFKGGDQVAHSRRHFLQCSGVGLLSLALSACGGDDDDEDEPLPHTVAWGRQAIRAAMQASPDTAAVSIALLHGGRIVWQEAFGLASTDPRAAASIDTRFNIGSVSKVFAGLTGVILQDRGLLSLDRPIVDYLPGFSMLSPGYRRITSRQLLSHSSGLPGTNSHNLFTFQPIPGYAEDTEAGLAYYHLKHEPGQLAVYCNDGFTLFERVVRAVSGLSYAEFVRQNVLVPLEMTQSGYLLTLSPEGSFAHPRLDGRQYGQEVTNAYATGGLCTTPGDMMKLARMFLDGGVYEGRRIVSEAGIAAMAVNQNTATSLNPSSEWRWGLGWDSVRQVGMDAAGVLAWEKNGGTAFFSTEFFVLPRARMALLLTGNHGYDPLSIAEGVLLRALEEAKVIASRPQPVDTVAPPAAASVVPAEALGIYGNYVAPIKVEADVGGALMLSVWSAGAWAPLNEGVARYTARTDGWWWGEGDSRLPCYRFVTAQSEDAAGQVRQYRYLMVRVAPGAGVDTMTMPLGQQLAARSVLSQAWQARLGTRWQVTNESADSISPIVDGDDPVALETLAELPGYLLYGGQLLTPLDDNRAGMSVKVPVNHGRDLVELVFSASDPQTMRSGSLLYARV